MHQRLITQQPRGPSRSHFNRTSPIGNRTRRIRDKRVELRLRVCRRRIERQLAVRMEVKLLRDDVLFRRPLAVLDPLVAAGPERKCFRALGCAFVFQVMREERRQNVFAIVRGSRTAKIDGSKFAAFTSRPAAMVPRTDHEKVLLLRVVPFRKLVDLDWAVEVFLVPPRDVQRRHGHARQPRLKALSFPERVVIRMIDEVVPARQPPLSI